MAECRYHGAPVTVSEVLGALIDEYDFARRLGFARGWFPIDVREVEPPADTLTRQRLTDLLPLSEHETGTCWQVWDRDAWTRLAPDQGRAGRGL